MKTYGWTANFHWVQDPQVPITTFTAITRGEPIQADSEDQARDRVDEKLTDKYGKLLKPKIYVHELEGDE